MDLKTTDHPSIEMLRLLGGDRFLDLTGASDFVSADNPQPRMLMRLPATRTRQRGTNLEISLAPGDEYTLVYFKKKRGSSERNIIAVNRHVRPENLRQSFEDLTGLSLTLGEAFDSREMTSARGG